eukprot:5678534-Prymnesium_polylepis.2
MNRKRSCRPGDSSVREDDTTAARAQHTSRRSAQPPADGPNRARCRPLHEERGDIGTRHVAIFTSLRTFVASELMIIRTHLCSDVC